MSPGRTGPWCPIIVIMISSSSSSSSSMTYMYIYIYIYIAEDERRRGELVPDARERRGREAAGLED